jgi:hypothetical protein
VGGGGLLPVPVLVGTAVIAQEAISGQPETASGSALFATCAKVYDILGRLAARPG